MMSISVPPALAKEYRALAKEIGESASEFFREIFTYYKQPAPNWSGNYNQILPTETHPPIG